MATPAVGLPVDGLVDGGGDPVRQGALVDGDAVALGPHDPDEVVGARQAARVRGEDAARPSSLITSPLCGRTVPI